MVAGVDIGAGGWGDLDQPGFGGRGVNRLTTIEMVENYPQQPIGGKVNWQNVRRAAKIIL